MIDITGQIFGKYLVIKHIGYNNRKNTIWLCKCNICGYEKSLRSDHIKRLGSTKCKCPKNLQFQRFGKLVVLNKLKYKHKSGDYLWECLCDCGTIHNVTTSALIHNHTKSCGCYALEQMSGENNHNWKGGISSEDKNDRIKFDKIKNSILSRDNFTCYKCNYYGGKLNVHHIYNFADYKNVRLSKSNLITLCNKCHKKYHNIYGVKNNTLIQFEEFTGKSWKYRTYLQDIIG